MIIERQAWEIETMTTVKQEITPSVLLMLFDAAETKPDTWEKMLPLLRARVDKGLETYGVPLTTFNGRDALMDAWEEVCDSILYLRQCVMEGKEELATVLDNQIVQLLKITDLMT